MSKRFHTSMIIASSFVLILGFQNCAKTEFASDPAVASLKTENMLSPEGLDESNGDINLVDADPVPEQTPPPEESPMPKSPQPSPQPPIVEEEAEMDPSRVVECDLNGPKTKIILNMSFQGGSNASASRVCMSENACLNIVNAYASARNCSLEPGPAKSAPSGQCSAIFPGSKGTCKNAKILSDPDVSALLDALAVAP